MVPFLVLMSTVYPEVLKSFGTVEFTIPAMSMFRKSFPALFVSADKVIVTVLAMLFTTIPSSARPPLVAVSASWSSVSATAPEQVLPLATVLLHLNLIVPVPGPFKSPLIGEFISCWAADTLNPVGNVSTMVPEIGICFEIGKRTP